MQASCKIHTNKQVHAYISKQFFNIIIHGHNLTTKFVHLMTKEIPLSLRYLMEQSVGFTLLRFQIAIHSVIARLPGKAHFGEEGFVTK